jgi:hypothetical protein
MTAVIQADKLTKAYTSYRRISRERGLEETFLAEYGHDPQ